MIIGKLLGSINWVVSAPIEDLRSSFFKSNLLINLFDYFIAD